MVFSSFPVYMDPPNWQQQVNQQQQNNITNENSFQHLLSPPPCPQQPPPPPSQHHHQFNSVGGGGHTHGGGPNMLGSIRPGSMVDRVRLAKLPLPEAGLKCPRCESTNTKFCYFNNYSLSQPRHFCKACKRYWTRGGALRNVPAGGGCRRNNSKRSSRKSSRSRSPVGTTTAAGRGGDIDRSGGTGGGLASSSRTHQDRSQLNNTTTASTTSRMSFQGHPPQVTLLPSLQHLGGGHNHHYVPRDHIGSLNLEGLIPPPATVTNTSSVGGGSGMNFDGSILPQSQQFPFLSADCLESPTTNGLFPSFDQDEGNILTGGGSSSHGLMIRDLNYQTKGLDTGGGLMSQIMTSSSVPKLEVCSSTDNDQGLLIDNSSKNNILQLGQLGDGDGINQMINGAAHDDGDDDDQQYNNWNGSCTWADLSRFTQSSSSTHLL